MPRPAKKTRVEAVPEEDVPSAGSGFKKPPPLVDDAVMAGLPQVYHTLHQMMIEQPSKSWSIGCPVDLFNNRDDGSTHITLDVADVVQFFKKEWVSSAIVQLWCM